MKIIKLLGPFLLVLGILFPICSFTQFKMREYINEITLEKVKDEGNYFAILEIDAIGLKRELFEIDSYENQVSKNILVHKKSIFPGNDHSHVILAAHSGNGKSAFFKDLDQLQLRDEITLYYQGVIWTYEIIEIEEQEKTGVLYLKENDLDLISLITCTEGKANTQTIFYGKLKEHKNL